MLINIHIVTSALLRKERDKPKQVPNANLRQDAYAVHRTCRSLAASVFPDSHIHKLITQFGRSTKFLARTWCCADTWKGTLQYMRHYIASLDLTDDVAIFLYRLSKCPAEIEEEITPYSKHPLLSNIINFHRTTVPLIRSMNEVDNQTQYLWFEGSSQIAAETIQIYDTVLISSLTLLPEISPADSSASTVALEGISGIQIGLGDYGIGVEALRILYQDGTSACIGAARESSCITIIGTNIKGLKFGKDV